jgi:hypothetical protein
LDAELPTYSRGKLNSISDFLQEIARGISVAARSKINPLYLRKRAAGSLNRFRLRALRRIQRLGSKRTKKLRQWRKRQGRQLGARIGSSI